MFLLDLWWDTRGSPRLVKGISENLLHCIKGVKPPLDFERKFVLALK